MALWTFGRHLPTPARETVFIVDGFYICGLCLDGKGGECHSPGCALYLCTAPDLPIRQKLADFGARIMTPEFHAAKCIAGAEALARAEEVARDE